MGDKAPIAAEGVSGERLMFHSAALVLTIGALVCFVWAFYALFRKRQKTSAELESILAEHAPVEVETAPAPSPIVRREQPKGFGRKSS